MWLVHARENRFECVFQGSILTPPSHTINNQKTMFKLIALLAAVLVALTESKMVSWDWV